MPRGDGTGPMGKGPMTGRGRGYCAGYNMPGFMNPGFGYGGMGMGWGRGFGRGWGRGYGSWNSPWFGGAGSWYGPQDKKEAKEMYQEEIEAILKDVKKALSELDKEK